MSPDVKKISVKEEEKIFLVYYQTFSNADNSVSCNWNFETFNDQISAAKFAKKIKNARFRIFPTNEECEEFQRNGVNFIKTEFSTCTQNSFDSSEYHSPKVAELGIFRQSIKTNNITLFNEFVWNNPRFLINSNGDTPVIVHEGFRYNALHLAAREGNLDIAEALIATLEDINIFKRLYSNDSLETSKSRQAYLIDLYLNTPEKGCLDAPLHISSKWGHVDLVAFLSSHPYCDVNMKNKFSQTPLDVACMRHGTDIKKDLILKTLQTKYYLPLYEYINCEMASYIGSPVERCTDDDKDGAVIAGFLGPIFKNRVKSVLKCINKRRRSYQLTHLENYMRNNPTLLLRRILREVGLQSSVQWIEFLPCLDEYCCVSSEKCLKNLEGILLEKLKDTNWNKSGSNGQSFLENDSLEGLASKFSTLYLCSDSELRVNLYDQFDDSDDEDRFYTPNSSFDDYEDSVCSLNVFFDFDCEPGFSDWLIFDCVKSNSLKEFPLLSAWKDAMLFAFSSAGMRISSLSSTPTRLKNHKTDSNDEPWVLRRSPLNARTFQLY